MLLTVLAARQIFKMQESEISNISRTERRRIAFSQLILQQRSSDRVQIVAELRGAIASDEASLHFEVLSYYGEG